MKNPNLSPDLLYPRRVAQAAVGAIVVVSIVVLVLQAVRSGVDLSQAPVAAAIAAATPAPPVQHDQVFVPTTKITFGEIELQPPTF